MAVRTMAGGDEVLDGGKEFDVVDNKGDIGVLDDRDKEMGAFGGDGSHSPNLRLLDIAIIGRKEEVVDASGMASLSSSGGKVDGRGQVVQNGMGIRRRSVTSLKIHFHCTIVRVIKLN
jgi:hypothetical protein